MRIRVRVETPDKPYPEKTVRVMGCEMYNVLRVIKHHFARRHTNGNKAVRNWCAEFKRLDKGSGFAASLRQTAK